MDSKLNILAIIPARGGSKRLPGKNILLLKNKPLIAWTIEAALNSKYKLDVIVSTDDQAISDIAKQFGAEVPFIRPEEISDDNSTSIDVVKHTLSFLKEKDNRKYDFIILLQPTSPLRNNVDIDLAIDLLIDKEADSIISMCECEHSPLWTNTLPSDNSLDNFQREELLNKRAQDLPIYYRFNGAIYISKVDRLFKEKRFFFNTKSYSYIMPSVRSIDIDNVIDFKLAEAIML